MKLTIRLFATLRQRIGSSSTVVDVEEPAIVADVLDVLVEKYPVIKPSMETLLIAVNKEFAERAQLVSREDEIALFPPVSGG